MRDDYLQPWHEEFLCLHGFAFLGTKGFTSHVESLRGTDARACGGSPKTVRIPRSSGLRLRCMGSRPAAGLPVGCSMNAADRMIAAVICSSFLRISGTPAQRRTPVCLISGELESRLRTHRRHAAGVPAARRTNLPG